MQKYRIEVEIKIRLRNPGIRYKLSHLSHDSSSHTEKPGRELSEILPDVLPSFPHARADNFAAENRISCTGASYISESYREHFTLYLEVHSANPYYLVINERERAGFAPCTLTVCRDISPPRCKPELLYFTDTSL